MPVLKRDEEIRNALEQCRTIAVIGISPKPYRPSYFVSDVLKDKGFKLYLVNPNYEGQNILGERVYGSMSQIPESVPVDMVDVFRRPSAVPSVAEEAVARGFKTFWMQPGTENMDVVRELDRAGYNVVAGRCAKMESLRLL